MIQFYGYKKCSTCRKAEKFLEQVGCGYEFIDITINPPSAAQLESIARLAQVELNKLFNTSGVQYRELKISQQLPGMDKKAMLELLAGNGRLVKRPLVTDGKRATVGFNDALYRSVWS